MNIFFTKSFKKRFAKLPEKIQKKFEIRVEVFLKNPFDRTLENHPLTGNLLGFRSFSITGNYRVKFIVLDIESVKFVDIDTHPHIYK